MRNLETIFATGVKDVIPFSLESFAQNAISAYNVHMPAGRPSSWTQEIEDEILLRLSHGEPLSKICRDEHIPAESTIYRWEDHVEGFSEKVSRARERTADHYSHEIIEIAEETPVFEQPDPDGGTSVRIDPAGIQRNKLRIDTRIKLMQMLKRKTYGEKSSHSLENPDGTAIQFVAKSILEK